MNPLPLVITLALLTGCTVLETKDGAVTCHSQECVKAAHERTGWMQEMRRKTANAEAWEAGERAKEKAEEDRVRKENRAWAAAHPEETARRFQETVEYLDRNNQSINAYGCPGTSVPMTWAPWLGPSACGYRSW